MAKLPSFQFYPGDWLKDPNLRRCSKAAKGMWIDMLCLMHENDERGVFSANGQPWSDDEIASAVDGNPSENLALLAELCKKGVARRRDDRSIFCQRMVKDENLRQVRAVAGSEGGKQKRSKPPSKTQAKAKQIPEDEEEESSPPVVREAQGTQRADCALDFSAWWAAYPHKVGKKAAEKAYETARKSVSAKVLLDGVRAYIRTKPADRAWCNPATWLNQGRWEDQPATASDASVDTSGLDPCLPKSPQEVRRMMIESGMIAEGDTRD